MIKSLLIKNFIIIDEQKIIFEPGFNVLSGETGAGKSILVGAVNLALGAQAKGNLLRNKAEKAVIEAVFDSSQNEELKELLKKYEVEDCENEFFILREILPNNSSKIFLNGRRVTNSIIREFQRVLIDFHSQRDQNLLLESETQLAFLDKFGNLEELAENFGKLYNYRQKLKANLVEKIRAAEEMKERKELYSYQLKEIEEMDLTPGEDVRLEKEMKLLSHAEEILQTSDEIEFIVTGKENCLADELNKIIHKLSYFENEADCINAASDHFNEAIAHLCDGVEEISRLKDITDIDEEKKEETEERFNAINILKMKYRKTIDEIIDYAEEIRRFTENFSAKNKDIEILTDEISAKEKEMKKKAEELSEKRKKAALDFGKEVQKNLRFLAMPNAEFEVRFDDLSTFGVTGSDRIDFYFKANKGQEMQPVADAVSGGELSRLLLTLKKVLGERMKEKVIVFDEIDAGVGGKTAKILAKFIKDVGLHHQVLCITHLPQVAALADTHYFIQKKETELTTVLDIKKIDFNQRINEIARMLSGDSSERSLAHAKELLEENKKFT
ncbi:MAG: DNA repair protein RecN [Candidatus Cloacimonadota bacterium]|nr:MAG: DNA repair protein RecN [Candidatus Cloacimonadota bacterium]